MNVLEKILEEISEIEKEYVTGHKVLYALGDVGMATEISNIIRSHMNDGKEINVSSNWIPVEDEDTCDKWSEGQVDWKEHMLSTFLAGH